MNLPTIVVLAAVGICTALALRSIFRNIKRGNYCSGCGNACGGNCGHCSAADCGSRKKEYESETNTSGQE
ncbi:MAG: FeoB-associated Cys-rich membrane protein [Anaerovoracaceae bacterium]